MVRSADRLRGAGSKEPGARSMCKTRQSGPVRPRGPQRCGLVRPKTPSPPAPLPETVRSMAGEGRGKRYGGWHGIAGRECHASAPSHNHDRLDPPAAQRFSAFFPDLWLGLIDQVLPGKQANPGGGRLKFSRIPRAPNNHFSIFRSISRVERPRSNSKSGGSEGQGAKSNGGGGKNAAHRQRTEKWRAEKWRL